MSTRALEKSDTKVVLAQAREIAEAIQRLKEAQLERDGAIYDSVLKAMIVKED